MSKSRLAMLVGFSFKSNINKRKKNDYDMAARYSYIATLGIFIQLCLFKQFYNHADQTQASDNYIAAAISKADFSLWPIGYSKFIYFIHSIDPSDITIVITQYMLLEIAALAFFLTIINFYNLRPYIATTLFIFLIFNPLSLYISNYILPDSLFITISLIWAANLIATINKPDLRNSIINFVLLFLLITLKYQAFYYPLISVIAIIYSDCKKYIKIVALGATLLVTLIAIEITKQAGKRESGTRQLSPIMSWYLANNALYAYPHIDVSKIKFPKNTDILNLQIKENFDNNGYKITPRYGPFYLYAFKSPLRQYWVDYLLADKTKSVEQAGCKLAPIVSNYGKKIIQEYPWKYAKYYLIPNISNYLFPLIYEISIYNSGSNDVSLLAKEWFQYKNSKISCTFPHLQGKVFLFYSSLFLMTNITIIIGSIFLFAKRKLYYQNTHLHKILIVTVSIYVINAIFCITLQPVDLTTLLFPVILYPCLILIILNIYIDR